MGKQCLSLLVMPMVGKLLCAETQLFFRSKDRSRKHVTAGSGLNVYIIREGSADGLLSANARQPVSKISRQNLLLIVLVILRVARVLLGSTFDFA